MIKQTNCLKPQGTRQGNEKLILCRRTIPFSYFPLILIGFLLGGCAEFTSIFRTYDAKETSIVIDAKQRTIISRNGKVCAEPSPDALSVLSANASITGSYLEKFTAYLTGSTAESATSIGLRTQTIQLLRDGMYRLCEGHMMDALDSIQFSRLQRRYQNVMLGLLSIEQMTGAVTPQPVILESQSGSSSTNDVVKIQEQVNANRKTIETTELEIAKAEKALAGAKQANDEAQKVLKEKKDALKQEEDSPSNPPQKETLNQDMEKQKETANTTQSAEEKAGGNLKKLKQELSDYQENQELLENALKNSRNIASKASAAGRFGTPFQTNRLEKDTAMHVTKAVTAIVHDVLKVDRDYLVETCLTLLSNSIDSKTDLFNALLDPEPKVRNKAIDIVNYCSKLLQKSESDSPVIYGQSGSNDSMASSGPSSLSGSSSKSSAGTALSGTPSENSPQPSLKTKPDTTTTSKEEPTQPQK